MKFSFFLWGSALLVTGTSAFQPVSVHSRGVLSPGDTPLTPLSALVDFDERTGRDVGPFDEWAVNCGVMRSDGFQLTTEDGLDWSVMSNADLAAGSPVLHVPNVMVLSSNKAKAELNGAQAEEYLRRLGAGDQINEFYLWLKVLSEYEQGDASPFFPWLNSLPRLFYNSVSMTDFCYECLPPLVFSLARTERVKFDNFHAAVAKTNCLKPETTADLPLLKWAFNIVYTRCLEGNSEKYIAPMADMFNHGTETEVQVQYDDEGNCNVFTTVDVSAGSPLRMSYGDPTNPSQLFARYGFLDKSSPATFCKYMIQPTQQLLDIGYDPSRMLFYKDTGDISEEVWDVMLYQVLAKDRDAQQGFYQAHMSGDVDTKRAYHQQYMYDTSNALKTHVDTFLKQLDELSDKAVGKDINQHPRLPLILSHNEFVKSTFLTVQQRLDAIVAEAVGEPVGAF